MREALTLALQETEAAVVIVSHDRHLLRATCDELWLVADGKLMPFDGDLDDYAKWLDEQRSKERKGESSPATAEVATKAATPVVVPVDVEAAKSALAGRRALQKDLEKLEKQLASWQGELKLLETRLADPGLYANPDPSLVQSLNQRQASLSKDVEAGESRWLELHEAMEAFATPGP
jgi:ATP-binding cassette subfamily F protein 3